jgi:hypothetical protein
MKRFLFATCAMLALGLGACAGQDDASANNTGADDDEEVIASDPLAMPKPMLTFLKTERWGAHHLEWHTVRQWDLLDPSDQAYAKRQHWARADIQEGAKGNGLEFLAMHRVMIRILKEKFPSDAALFDGWAKPPTDPKDKNDPCSQGTFDPAKLQAIDKLENHLADFKTDDELGLYLETGLFMDPNSKIDIGDPSVNLQNRRFWRLHGWIESRWTEFRKIKHMSDDDPSYKAAIKKAEDMLRPGMVKGLPGEPAPEAPPASLRKFFEKQPD